MEPIDFEHGGESYQLIPHTGFTALNLDRKVTAIFGRVLASPGAESGLPADADSFVRLTEALGALSDEDYKWLVGTTLSPVTVTTPGKKNVSLHSGDPMETIAAHFAGRLGDLNAVMLKVWQLEKLTPFGEAPAGG